VILSLAVRFCIPAVGTATGKITGLFLEEKSDAAASVLEKSTHELGDIETLLEEPADMKGESHEPDIWERARDMFGSAKSKVDLKRMFEQVRQKASAMTEYIVDLMVVFLLQTMVIPILVLWGLVRFSVFLMRKNISGFI